MREIKFKRAHFKDEAKTQFSHFSEWGVGIKETQFTSPSQNNFAIYFEDIQFTGLLDKKGIEIYDGEKLNKKTTFDNNMSDRRFQLDTEIEVGFENGCFIDKNTGVCLYDKMRTISSFRHDNWTDYESVGNIYENETI